MYRDLGQHVRRRRVRLKLTQRVVAREVNRSHSWLSNLENGKAGRIDATVLTALAVALEEEPASYLRMAGMSVLTAEGVVPAGGSALPAGLVDAIRVAFREELRDALAEAGLLPAPQ